MKHVVTSQEPDSQTETDGGTSELVWGARAIAQVLGRTPRAVFHLASIGAIPVEHVGNRLVARKSRLLKIAG